MVRVAVVGCSHGQLDAMYATIEHINSMEPERPVQVLLCCGDFQSFRNETDMHCMACPPKYKELGVFHEYYSGRKVAPVLTIFIGGNHEASNYLQDLYYGGYVAPNIFYLGSAGVVNVNGLRIAGLSGIYKSQDYTFGNHEAFPYDQSTMRSIYHVREFQVYQLAHLRGKSPIDIMLSHDWPRGIERYGRTDVLLRKKSFLRDEIARGEFGSPPGEYLLHTLQPKYWFSGHMHVKFAAVVHHPTPPDAPAPGNLTKFLALDKCLPHRDFMQITDITPSGPCPATDTVTLNLDPEWLAVLRGTHHIASSIRLRPRVPEEEMAIEAADVAWVTARLEALVDGSPERAANPLAWIRPFELTAPPAYAPPSPVPCVGNPQTDALLALLKLPHVVTLPYVPLAATSEDPNSIDIDVDDEDTEQRTEAGSVDPKGEGSSLASFNGPKQPTAVETPNDPNALDIDDL
ncbi:lariat debranching enzyme B [Achlya hypogyna]|uniref:Lariat debranching enzyme B n=1 Tax=Achlya hypogyna TaxID=1202772 RepID=A0A1V9ZLF6_ACHHY|nr:lariat debranching enzyme B [Achlya hypogyna]